MKKQSIKKFFIAVFVIIAISFIHSFPFVNSAYKTLVSFLFDIFGNSVATSLLFGFLLIPVVFVAMPLIFINYFLIKNKKISLAFLLPISTFLVGIFFCLIYLGKDVYGEGAILLAMYIFYVGVGVLIAYVVTLGIYFYTKIKRRGK